MSYWNVTGNKALSLDFAGQIYTLINEIRTDLADLNDTKVTKGGDAPAAALAIGTTNIQPVSFIQNNNVKMGLDANGVVMTGTLGVNGYVEAGAVRTGGDTVQSKPDYKFLAGNGGIYHGTDTSKIGIVVEGQDRLTVSDVATICHDNMIIAGRAEVGTRVLFAETGSQAAPVISFLGDGAYDTGMYSEGDGNISFTTNNDKCVEFTPNRVTTGTGTRVVIASGGTADAPGLSFGTTASSGMYSNSGGMVGISHNTVSAMEVDFNEIRFTPLGERVCTMVGEIGTNNMIMGDDTKLLLRAEATASNPALAFNGDAGLDTGMYTEGGGNISFTSNGTKCVEFNTNTVRLPTSSRLFFNGNGSNTAPQVTFDTDTGIYTTGDGNISFTSNGAKAVEVSPSTVRLATGSRLFLDGNGSNTAPQVTFDADTGIYTTGDGNVSVTNNGNRTLAITPSTITVIPSNTPTVTITQNALNLNGSATVLGDVLLSTSGTSGRVVWDSGAGAGRDTYMHSREDGVIETKQNNADTLKISTTALIHKGMHNDVAATLGSSDPNVHSWTNDNVNATITESTVGATRVYTNVRLQVNYTRVGNVVRGHASFAYVMHANTNRLNVEFPAQYTQHTNMSYTYTKPGTTAIIRADNCGGIITIVGEDAELDSYSNIGTVSIVKLGPGPTLYAVGDVINKTPAGTFNFVVGGTYIVTMDFTYQIC